MACRRKRPCWAWSPLGWLWSMSWRASGASWGTRCQWGSLKGCGRCWVVGIAIGPLFKSARRQRHRKGEPTNSTARWITGWTTKFISGISTFWRKCNDLNSGSANFFFVISFPTLAPPPPTPPPRLSLPLSTYKCNKTWFYTTNYHGMYGVSSPPKRLRRWSCIYSGTSGSRCVVRCMSVSVVMCVEWYVHCGWGCRYVLVFHRHLRHFYVNIWIARPNIAQSTDLFKLRQSEARVVSRCRLLSPDSSSWCPIRTTHWVLEGQEVPLWLLKFNLSWWKSVEEGQRDGRPLGRG